MDLSPHGGVRLHMCISRETSGTYCPRAALELRLPLSPLGVLIRGLTTILLHSTVRESSRPLDSCTSACCLQVFRTYLLQVIT